MTVLEIDIPIYTANDAEIIGMARKSPARPEPEANYGAALREAYDRYYNQS